jgi:hypothetical protein
MTSMTHHRLNLQGVRKEQVHQMREVITHIFLNILQEIKSHSQEPMELQMDLQ